MSPRMRDLLTGGFGQLRHEPTAKRIRAVLGGGTVVDTTRALLVWEPRRIVPSYAVPDGDVTVQLILADPAAADAAGTIGARMPELSSRPVLDPSVPFAVHTAEGRAVDLSAGGRNRPGAGFYPADPDLAGYVVLDSRRSRPGMRRRSSPWPIPVTRSTASTSSPARARSGWNWTATSWPSLHSPRCF